jgi:adenosylcobinamide kinase/adenosylcobinamide-phosphate guanylyltransferase
MATERSGYVTLLLGGARSGKSRYAQQLAAGSERVAFIATATASDDEMRRKIARHQADRPTSWRTYEAPLDLEATIQAEAGGYQAVVIDCLTLWTANLLHYYQMKPEPIVERADALCGLLSKAETRFFLVSNEVGESVVPAYESGRIFRDVLGELNQRVARVADRVLLMVAGYPLVVKPNPEERR